MQGTYLVKRTTASDKDFEELIGLLDNELWNELKEDQATYDQYNKVPDIKTAVVIYDGSTPVACGCYKEYAEDTVEIKRMFVRKTHRGKGLSKLVLSELEKWAADNGYTCALLETSIHFKTAKQLYETSGYTIIPNYEQYADLPESICMKKELSLTANHH